MKDDKLTSKKGADLPIVFEAIGCLLFGAAAILTTRDWMIWLFGIMILVLAGFFLYGGLILERQTS